MCVVGIGHVVTKLLRILAGYATHIAATKDHLLAPDWPSAAVRYNVVLCAKQQVGYEWAADSLVPGLRLQGAAPDSRPSRYA